MSWPKTTTTTSRSNKLWRTLALLLTFSLYIVIPTTVIGQNPQSGDIDISGKVTGAPPTSPAVILQPTNGQHFSTNQITVSGTCPADSAFVHILRNDVFAGSTSCTSGEFSLIITLLPGENRLLARVFSADNQPGPDSNVVTVFLDEPGPSPTPPVPPVPPVPTPEPLLLLTKPIYPGGYVQKRLEISVEVLGGSPPYAVSIDWDDASSDLLVRTNVGSFTVSHIYTESGTYEVAISASDNAGRRATIQTIVIVSGEPVRVELDTLIERHSQSIWVRIIGPILIILITYVAGLITGLKIVGDELRDQHKL